MLILLTLCLQSTIVLYEAVCTFCPNLLILSFLENCAKTNVLSKLFSKKYFLKLLIKTIFYSFFVISNLISISQWPSGAILLNIRKFLNTFKKPAILSPLHSPN